MSCTFQTNAQGQIIDVRNEDGSPSQLFQDALAETGDRQQSIDLVAITKTDDFLEVYSEEPSLQTVMEYVARENANKKQLSPQQSQDFKNSLMSLEASSVEDVQTKMQQAFYVNNLFAPTEDSLSKSGLYSPYEVQTILRDIDLQERIKSAVEALKNTEVTQAENYLEIPATQKTNELNSFGKLTAVNPYEIEKTVIDTLGGIENQTEFNDALATIEYPVATQGLYNRMQQYVRAQEMTEEGGRIIPATLLQDKKAEILLGMSDQVNPQTLSNIDTILNTPDAVLDENAESLDLLLQNIENNLIAQGLDVVGLREQGVDKEFLSVLEEFLIDPSPENTEDFLAEYARVFDLTSEPKTRVLKQQEKNRSYVYLETKKPEDQLLMENNLLKVGNNTYIKVRRKSTQYLYDIVSTYPEKFPKGANLSEYVQSLSSQIENIEDRDLAEELTLLKMYFGVPLNISPTVDIANEAQKEEVYKPISEDFIVDFQAERLKQKQKNSAQWKNFYRFFSINNKGITLTNDDSITLDTINEWIGEIKTNIANGLRQFSVISTQLPNLNSSEEVITDKSTMRSVAINYPAAIDKIHNESYRVDEDVIILKNSTDNFVKLDNQNVFEAVENKGNLTMFVKLPQNNTGYNMYKNAVPTTTKELAEYTYLETQPDKWVNAKNTLSKEKREEIKSKNFEC